MSIKTGTVTASVILRKLAAYPRQNRLAVALRELGKLERTFSLAANGLTEAPDPGLALSQVVDASSESGSRTSCVGRRCN